MQIGQVAAFVNFVDFSLHSPEMKDLADLFWLQLELISPASSTETPVELISNADTPSTL
jgi:hypothetical protein